MFRYFFPTVVVNSPFSVSLAPFRPYTVRQIVVSSFVSIHRTNTRFPFEYTKFRRFFYTRIKIIIFGSPYHYRRYRFSVPCANTAVCRRNRRRRRHPSAAATATVTTAVVIATLLYSPRSTRAAAAATPEFERTRSIVRVRTSTDNDLVIIAVR